MFDSKVLIVILVIALIVCGTKRLRSIGSDLGGAIKDFKQAMHDAESSGAERRIPEDR
jgi:sec-independent protein translocase protein TatA